ncbi:transposase [Chitinophagaceae bacterium OAS944]|nr:transposase [Chitinophagaceae bacterium OAS944]
MDNHPVSCHQLARTYQMDGSQLQQQYKHHISDYKDWDQREHATEWMLFEKNMGTHLSIDETALSNDELYTVVTNKSAKGQKGAIVAMIKGTLADKVTEVLLRINKRLRDGVQEVTLDMAAGMHLIVRRCFPKARRVVDRFHVQQLASEAVQEIRIKHRWLAIDEENAQIAKAKKKGLTYVQQLLPNGDSPKQLLARSRYLLFKHKERWTYSQKQRAALIFERYPAIKNAYDLSMRLTDIFNHCKCREEAFKKLALWYNHIEEANIESFRTVFRTIETHYESILNYFDNRSTNASTEAFNAKIKSFRASARGVRDISFFLFRLSKIYA